MEQWRRTIKKRLLDFWEDETRRGPRKSERAKKVAMQVALPGPPDFSCPWAPGYVVTPLRVTTMKINYIN